MNRAALIGWPICVLLLLTADGHLPIVASVARAAADSEWIDLFDGQSLNGWRAAENAATWQVRDGCLVAQGERSHLFYAGPLARHDFRNFDLRIEVRTAPQTISGIYFHTDYQPTGWPEKGYQVQLNNTHWGTGDDRELKRTGSLSGVRNIYKSNVVDHEWFLVRICIVQNRVRVWVNGVPTVDYLQPEKPYRVSGQTDRVLSHGTIALQGHDPNSRVEFRAVRIRLLSDDAHALEDPRASDEGYGITQNLIDRFAGHDLPVIDFHVHLRGGMTVADAIARQAVTGVNCGVLRNIGKGWIIETDQQLREFLDEVKETPVFVGLQVNDRDWMHKHSADLLKRLDYVLGDTMIMPMPSDDDEPVKLWMADGYTISDPEAWMERYVRHNLRVLSEPITILANPTYLPPPVEDLYDQLWTEERMRKIIQAAVKNNVALEINASSGLPSERFVRMAKQMGARFTFGSNNFDDRPINMSHCFDAIERYDLTRDDLYVPRSTIGRQAVAAPGG
jgi:hypothetical protein